MTTAAVAVKSADGRGSQRAVRWAVENLMHKADRLVLVHVMPTITSVPTPVMYLIAGGSIPIKALDASVVEMYLQDVREKCEEDFLTFKYLYSTQTIETLLLEGGNPAFVLLRYICDSKTSCLVMGSCSKSEDSEVPSIVLEHAPDTCDIYVVSPNKLVSNSLNPMLSTGTAHQASEDSLSDMRSHKGFSAISSTYSEKSEIVAEIEQLRLQLENTLTMYKRACEDLVCAQRKVLLLSSECTQEAQRVNAAQKREQNLRKIGSIEKEKYLEAQKEVEKAKELLGKETYERQIAELKIRRESLEKKRIVDALLSSDRRYRRYTRDDIQLATALFFRKIT
ncbi:hypothetical protein OROHE_022076 [Orobanche hederae]